MKTYYFRSAKVSKAFALMLREQGANFMTDRGMYPFVNSHGDYKINNPFRVIVYSEII